MKIFGCNRWSLSTWMKPIAMMLACCSLSMHATEPNAAGGVRLLKPSSAEPVVVTLKEAFALSLKNHRTMLFAQNYLQRARVENTMKIGAVLPKLRLGGSYTRNIPEVESNPFAADTQYLNRHVATLLRNSGDTTSADEVDRQTDLMSRRRPNQGILISPKHVVDAKLTLEVPLFNGPDIAGIVASGQKVLMHEEKLKDEEAQTLFATAKAYYAALHARNVLSLREQAESVAEERYLKADAQQKRGVIMEKDFLHAHANFLYKQAEKQGALISYRASIANLGLMVGQSEEFRVSDPDTMIFAPLEDNLDKLLEIALNHRPDLRAERQTLRVVEHERFGHFMQFLPTFTLLGDAKYTSNDRSLMGKNFTYAISINAQLNIFDGGISVGRLRDSNLRRQESEIKLAILRRDIDAKIRGQKERLAQLTLLALASERMAQAAVESEHVASSRHRRGLLDLQEFLEVSDKRLSAEIAHKKAESDLNEERLALVFEAGLLTPQFMQ